MQTKEKYFVSSNQSIQDIPKDIESLYFCVYGNRKNLTKLDFSSFGFTQLRSITIGSNCFHYVREFVLDGLANLESVNIGNECFRISDKERDDGVCRITNCPNLRELEIGWRSFYDFKQFELSNVNSLQSIQFGDNCFKNVREFVLDGLEKLESVKMGEECFRMSDYEERDDGVCRITNCPNLRQLEIGYRSFKDFKQFELSNVNFLQFITFGNGCFDYAENCILKGE